MAEFRYRPEREPEESRIEWSFEGVDAFMRTYGEDAGEVLEVMPCLRNLNDLIEVILTAPIDERSRTWNTGLDYRVSPKANAYLSISGLDRRAPPGTVVATILFRGPQTEANAQGWTFYTLICPEDNEFFGLQKKIGNMRGVDNSPKWVVNEAEVDALAALVADAIAQERK